MKKSIIALVAILSIAGIIFASWYITQQRPVTGPELARAPIVILEATVISLSPDTNIACEGVCPGYEYPIDTGVIKIDKIISIDNPYNSTLIGIEEGNEIQVSFFFSSRSAKIRVIPAPEAGSVPPETPVAHVLTSAKPIPKENGYFIYESESPSVTEVTETVLPGLEVGSKFKATGSIMQGTILIGEYELI